MSRPRSPRVRGGNIFNECSSEDGSHHSGTAFEGFTTFAVDGGLLAFRSENSYSDLSQLARASPSMSRLVSPDSIISQTPSVNKWYQRSDVAAPPMLRAGRSPAASPLCELAISPERRGAIKSCPWMRVYVRCMKVCESQRLYAQLRAFSSLFGAHKRGAPRTQSLRVASAAPAGPRERDHVDRVTLSPGRGRAGRLRTCTTEPCR